jgi:hypothetical protein
MIGSRIDDWLSRGAVVAVARVVHAVFFVAVAAYCFLSYSPFAYAQFIKPNVVPALTDFVMISQWYFCVVVLLTTLTLMPQLRGRPGQWLAVAYVVLWGALAALSLYAQPLRTIGNSRLGYAIGLLALSAPVWVAAIDHIARPAPDVRPARLSRLLAACIGTAIVGWAAYALAVPVRLANQPAIALGKSELAVALASSLVVNLYGFTALFLALATLIAIAQLSSTAARAEYWLFVLLLGGSAALILYFLVCASIAFVGVEAAAASGALGLALAAVWADLARLRAGRDRPLDVLALFGAPLAGSGSRPAAAAAICALPLVAYGLVAAVSHLDWNFLLQKLTVLLVWMAAFALVSRLGPAEAKAQYVRPGFGRTYIVPLLIFGLYHGFVSLEARNARATATYAALDPSYRLVRDARTARSAETAEYYAFLRSHTLIPPGDVPPLDVDLVKPLAPAAGRPPDIYLLIVDSLRRDYLSPYNPQVTFTPAIGSFASESYVFDRAFTRYAGTALSMASIWAGGMVPHMLEVASFERRNTLLKLLTANRYARMMNVDHIISDLVAPDDNLVQLDRGKSTMQFDLCSTLGELEQRVESSDPSRPIFFYSLPQNVHIAVASRRKVPAGESYPGFFPAVASSIRRIDGCLGSFIDFLKRTNRYDNSIVILTADHGDSLGEEGRWGHAFFIVPEVMRIPLIVHVSSRLRERMPVDLSALTFSSDIVPSLYALLGYEPGVPGPLAGRTAFGRSADDSAWRRRDEFLLASSYGAVYAVLRRNGTRMYVVDAVDGSDSAFDLSGDGVGRRLPVTETLSTESRAHIRQHLAVLARENRYRPRS